jgi:hypothetical protein
MNRRKGVTFQEKKQEEKKRDCSFRQLIKKGMLKLRGGKIMARWEMCTGLKGEEGRI